MNILILRSNGAPTSSRIFPNPAALLRFAGHVLIEQHNERDGADRRYFSERFVKLLTATDEEVAIPELNAA